MTRPAFIRAAVTGMTTPQVFIPPAPPSIKQPSTPPSSCASSCACKKCLRIRATEP